LAKDREKWWAVVKTVMKPHVPRNAGGFLEYMKKSSVQEGLCSTELVSWLISKSVGDKMYQTPSFVFLGAFAKFLIATVGFFMSVRPSVCMSARHNSAPTGQIFMKFGF
jgi:hypothetical protein